MSGGGVAPPRGGGPPPGKGSRAAAAGRWIRRHYMQMDPRTAGLYRIVAGFLLIADALRHWAVARTYYSNDGLLSNHWLLFKPPSSYHFTFFAAFSSIEEVHIAFALSVFCYSALMVGWHARLFAVLSFLWVTSQDARLLLVENGGYVVVNLVAMYACFLPIDRRFSIDAWRRSWREHRERRVEHLNQRTFAEGRDAPFVSGAVMLATLNLAFVYFFNVVNKSGSIWRAGDTVHYVLHIDRMITGLAVVVRELVPSALLKPAAWGVLAVEAMLMMLIFSPRARLWTRPMAMVGIALLHTSFGVMMRLGPFSWFMVGWSMVLPLRVHWEALERAGRARARAATVHLAAGSPLALAIGRVLARLDAYQLLRFEPATEAGAPLLAVCRRGDAGTGAEEETVSGSAATAQALVMALPWGTVWWRVARVLSLGLLPRLPGALERRRAGLERWLFASDAGVDAEAAPRVPPAPAPLTLRLVRVGSVMRELLVIWLALCFAVQAVVENKCVPPVLKPPHPEVMKFTTHIFRTLQGWGMFSPNPIQEDGILAIEAFTIDGRRIDPLTGREPVLDLVPVRGAGLGQIEQDYGNRIRSDRNEVYRKGIDDYLTRWHLVTGRPENEIVAFDVYWVTDKCPRPGSDHPTEGKKVAIRTWRKSGWKPPKGFPTIPPPPKLESAGN